MKTELQKKLDELFKYDRNREFERHQLYRIIKDIRNNNSTRIIRWVIRHIPMTKANKTKLKEKNFL